MQEHAIIATIEKLKSYRSNSLRGDDLCQSRLKALNKEKIYFSTDSVVENNHFKHEWSSPKEIARKLFFRNQSDFICSDIVPREALLNLGLSTRSASKEFIVSFLRELDRCFIQNNITLLGGDTTFSNTDFFTLTLIGQGATLLTRKGICIQTGDVLLQMGAVGGSNAGLKQLQSGQAPRSQDRKKYTEPRGPKKLFLRKMLKAALDQSDSVFKTFQLLAKENAIDFQINLNALLVHSSISSLPLEILRAAEDLAIFAIADQKIQNEKLPHDVRIIGKITRIQTRPQARYYWNQNKFDVHSLHDHEHFTL